MQITPVGKTFSILLQKCDSKLLGAAGPCNGVREFFLFGTFKARFRVVYVMGRYSMVRLEMLRPIQGSVSIASCTYTW